MTEIFRTLILPAEVTPLAQQIAATLSPGGAGMWTTALSPTGTEPATHYVSTGFITPEFASMVPEQYWEQDETSAWVETGSRAGDPDSVYAACTAAGMTVLPEDIEGVFAVADVTDQDPFVALSRMNLQLMNPLE